MSISDPIADALTILRNAQSVKKEKADICYSKILQRIFEIMKDHKYIKDYKKIEDSNKQGILRIYLKYENKLPAITGLKRISKSGLRVYKKVKDLPSVLREEGIAVISTPYGILTAKQAQEKNIGGEVLCYIW